jgi:hypothetical protein
MKYFYFITMTFVLLVGSALADLIHDEVIRGDIEGVRSLLNSGVDINSIHDGTE